MGQDEKQRIRESGKTFRTFLVKLIAHNAAFRDYVNFMSNNSHVNSLLDTQVRGKAVQLQEDKENNRAIIKLIIDLCRTMARQCISFRGTQSDADSNFAQLLSFRSRHCPKLKQWINNKHNRAYKVTYTSPQSHNEFLSLLGMEVKEKIVTDIKEAGVFSIMADTSPDVSHKNQMSVICRYVDQDGAAHERLLDLKEVRDKTEHSQATAIVQLVDQNGLDNKSIDRFQSYDFTRTVCRGNTMVHKQLSLGCLTEKYRTYHAKGIVQAAATGLLAKVLRVDFVVSLMFMRIILWKTKILTESLQKENLNIVDALEAVNITVKSLEDIRNDDEEISNQIQASTDVLSRNDGDVPAKFAKLHRPCSRPRRLDDNPESPAETSMVNFYDREFKEVLDILIAQYKDNIKASLEKVKALSIILQPPLTPNMKKVM